MSTDARGHLGDKYKKPNHPTFSVESKYSTASERGGKWIKRNGKTVYQASKYVTKKQGKDRLRKYFNEREKGVELEFEDRK